MSDILIPTMNAGQILSSDGTSRISSATGTSGQFLVADSTNSSGLSWSSLGSTGQIMQIYRTEVTATTNSVEITNIQFSPREIYVDVYATSVSPSGALSASYNVSVQFNQDSTSNAYSSKGFHARTLGPIIQTYEFNNIAFINLANSTVDPLMWQNDGATYLQMRIHNASSTSQHKVCTVMSRRTNSFSGYATWGMANWKNTNAITSIKLNFSGIGGIAVGSVVSVYGGTV
jgi:hypothetical protein